MSSIVISDIHIGTNYKTCWYQQSVHEPYLVALLDYVIQNANAGPSPITRLVILGDLFDFWTYPPNQRPPTVADIIAANPNIFGPTGKMREVVEALGGNVVYLRGNHDITVTQADLDLIPAGAYSITLVDDVYVDENIVFTHGHVYTMFNAPDPRYPGEVPVGHFVTRPIAYYLDNALPAGQTAADLPNQGSPYGFRLESLLPELAVQLRNSSITTALLDYIAARCGMPETLPIVMADGTTSSLADAKVKYDGLWTEWATAYGGGEIGATVAAKAAQADYDGSYMAWFAQKDAFERDARGTVTGHTHVPKSGIQNSSCLYVNSGFECPATPDIAAGSTEFTFARVDAGPMLKLFQVVRSGNAYGVAAASAAPDQTVFAPFMDFSCYVTVTNDGDDELVKESEQAQSGFYVAPPPASIPIDASVEIWLQDLTGVQGAEGNVTYRQASGTKSMQFAFGCPTGFIPNYAHGGASFVASSPAPPSANTSPNSVPETGHPLFVDFFVERTAPGDDSAGSAWAPTSLLARAVDLAGFRYDPDEDIIYSKMYPLQRQLGYAYGYDVAALTMSAIIDCEPIFFEYDGRTWMIELWKGQYGLETGCEIGVYYRSPGESSPLYALLDATIGRRSHDPTPSHNLFFDCVGDDDRLVMSSVLYRNGQKLFSRGPQKHWWLTGFEWGVLSRPEDLTMDVSIMCLSSAMCTALVDALEAMGYQGLNVVSPQVSFNFDTPKTFQPRSDVPALVTAASAANTVIVAGYNSMGFPNNDPNLIGGRADGLIANSIAIYSQTFAAQVIAGLAQTAKLEPGTAVLSELYARLSGAPA
jgi:UDP-2,3-diacylglucosamine pyrophosphatase LpxH